MSFKAGFVNIVGAPNVGKSTLINAMLGEKISIVTPKAQTTRHRILGIETTDHYQLIISDSPGVIVKPSYELHKRMMNFVYESLEDADILLLITEIHETAMPDPSFLDKLSAFQGPLIVGINKTDLDTEKKFQQKKKSYEKLLPRAEVTGISALTGAGIPELKNKIIRLLPEHAPYFEKDQLTDKSERFIVSEMVREKIFLLYAEEIPYSCEVVVTEFKDKENILGIRAEIWVERESQKTILLGKNGSKIKKLGIITREDIERFFGKKVFLELFVKVHKDWRKKAAILNQLGYQT